MSTEDLHTLEKLAEAIQSAASPRDAARYAAEMRALAEKNEHMQRERRQRARREQFART